jgi:penicillin G amidase
MELPKSGFFPTVFSALLRPLLSYLDHPSLPHYTGELSLAGLRQTVHVAWDDFAVPHVSAANEGDLFFVQGYLHAQERLWQMEMSRRFLSGRMAEIFGEFILPWKELSAQFRGKSSVEFDYFIRLLGIGAAASASLDQLNETERLQVNAYSAGVNTYIEHCGKKLPWEFRLLRHEPEPWRPLDTLTIGKGFAFLLSTALYSRLNLITVAEQLQHAPEKLRALMPTYPDDGPTITRAVGPQARGLWQFVSGSLAASEWHATGHGSNNWAIAPSRTSSGKAILCNDPHLRITLPSTWYLMHLRAESTRADTDPFDVWGSSIPGTPGIQLGHNRAIAWGITAAVCDDVEIYREKLHPVEPDNYATGEGWEKFTIQRETIGVRKKRGVEKTIRWTRHGPVLGDFSATANSKEVLAVRWTAHEPSQELRGLLALNRARNWQEFLDALRWHSAPSLNFVYADRDGNIGYTLAGKLPKRQQPSLLPVQGWDDRNEWREFIPFDELPRLYNPIDGVVATANHRIADAAYPYYLSHFFEPPHRIRRIHQLLGAQKTFSRASLAMTQVDTLSLHGKAFIELIRPELVDLADEAADVRSAAERLLSWNGDCAEDSVEAAIFHVLHHHILSNLLKPELGANAFDAYVEILNQCIVPTDAILGDSHSIWFARCSRTVLVRQALRQVCTELSAEFGPDIDSWRWGKIHRLQINHAFVRSKLLKPLLGIGPLGASGDGMTINFGFYRHSNPYAQTAGPSLRFTVELGAQPSSEFILPTGQSGHPLSPHFRDQTQMWLKGRGIELTSQQPPNSRRRLILRPD